ncbi:hypothetical protein N183_29210 [Sinorhizobium sp. Sb3]|nr:hypothetical protein N183_29210 [Sinorhizobium sp. Sb3]
MFTLNHLSFCLRLLATATASKDETAMRRSALTRR